MPRSLIRSVRPARRLLGALLLASVSCIDGAGPTGPKPADADAVRVRVGPSLVTVGASAGATLVRPAGVTFVPEIGRAHV